MKRWKNEPSHLGYRICYATQATKLGIGVRCLFEETLLIRYSVLSWFWQSGFLIPPFNLVQINTGGFVICKLTPYEKFEALFLKLWLVFVGVMHRLLNFYRHLKGVYLMLGL